MKIQDSMKIGQDLKVKFASPPKDTSAKVDMQDKISVGDADKAPETPKAKWLILNYIAADCNLKEFQAKNIDNQELVGSDENTHIVAYIDVGPKGSQEGVPIINWDGCKAFYVTKDNTPDVIKSPVIGDYGKDVDMSSPETLTKFLVEAMKNYPSEHVALILNDHGGAYTGAMSDESNGGFMSIPGIKRALLDAEKQTGKKLDILGFDACLMAELEVANELKDTATYLLASEETEGGPGWTYNEMLSDKMTTAINTVQDALKNKLTVSPKEFAEIIVNTNEAHSGDIPTFSATDLTKIDLLMEPTKDLAVAIKDTDDKAAIAQAAGEAQSYGGGWTPYADLQDMKHFSQLLIEKSPDAKVKDAAKKIIDAFDSKEVIISSESDQGKYKDSHGMTIYFPTSKEAADLDNDKDYKELSFMKEWKEAVKSVADAVGGQNNIGGGGNTGGNVGDVPNNIEDWFSTPTEGVTVESALNFIDNLNIGDPKVERWPDGTPKHGPKRS